MSTQLAPVAADTTSAATRQYRSWAPTADRYLLALVAEGRTHQQIARQLGMTRTAISRRIGRVFDDIGAINAPHAVAIALRDGLIPNTRRPSEAFVVVGPDREVILR